MDFKPVLLLTASLCFVLSQRPPYAGKHPIGYPEVEKTSEQYGGTTEFPLERLPLEARGDINLVKRLVQLPIDQQPFWLINWQALEWYRQHPRTYPIRENSFLKDP
ncbi:PREDICTED: uncharacterized protein LOC106126646 [Papilio xuthus]|uniref:Uncharacterized protein LOC106126646 n=1 Tax=Papilio xuthus TaxID=66420 RepID=A0AAJ6ZV97_PAPXU|nr:PREDICTED: uncharacterized protein LOC106126646 [Papilio xuthus]